MTPHEAMEKAIKEAIESDGDVSYYLADVAIEALRKGAEERVGLASKANYAATKKTRLSTAQIIDAVLGPKESE